MVEAWTKRRMWYCIESCYVRHGLTYVADHIDKPHLFPPDLSLCIAFRSDLEALNSRRGRMLPKGLVILKAQILQTLQMHVVNDVTSLTSEQCADVSDSRPEGSSDGPRLSRLRHPRIGITPRATQYACCMSYAAAITKTSLSEATRRCGPRKNRLGRGIGRICATVAHRNPTSTSMTCECEVIGWH